MNRAQYDEGRIMLLISRAVDTSNACFFHASTGDSNGGWSSESVLNQLGCFHTNRLLIMQVAIYTLVPVGQWTFFASATSTTTQKQSGFRYSLPSTSTRSMTFKTRSPSGAFYDLAENVMLYLGGDHRGEYEPCRCELRYARVYINYYPNSEDEYINLAMMDTGNKKLLISLTD